MKWFVLSFALCFMALGLFLQPALPGVPVSTDQAAMLHGASPPCNSAVSTVFVAGCCAGQMIPNGFVAGTQKQWTPNCGSTGNCGISRTTYGCS